MKYINKDLNLYNIHVEKDILYCNNKKYNINEFIDIVDKNYEDYIDNIDNALNDFIKNIKTDIGCEQKNPNENIIFYNKYRSLINNNINYIYNISNIFNKKIAEDIKTYILNKDIKSFSIKSLSDIIYFKPIIDIYIYYSFNDLYIIYLLHKYLNNNSKYAQGFSGPLFNLNYPMEERIIPWREIEGTLTGRTRDKRRQSRYTSGIEAYRYSGGTPGFILRDQKGEPFSFSNGKYDSPYPRNEYLYNS